MTNEPITISHFGVLYTIKADYDCATDMLTDMLRCIRVEIREIAEATGASQGMVMMSGRKIKGMIQLFGYVCDCPDLIKDLETQLSQAKTSAIDKMLD